MIKTADKMFSSENAQKSDKVQFCSTKVDFLLRDFICRWSDANAMMTEFCNVVHQSSPLLFIFVLNSKLFILHQ